MNEFLLIGAELSGQQVRQVIIGQIDNVIDLIDNSETGFDETIHAIRKSIKRIRAILRMIRFPMGKKLYDRENLFFRDVNRTISAIRDSKVNIDVFKSIVDEFSGEKDEQTIHMIDDHLSNQYNKLKQEFDFKEKGKEQLRSLLKDARRRLAGPEFDSIRKGQVMKGIKYTYLQGKKSLAIAEHDFSDRNLHELRKQVKHLRYQVQLIRFIWDPYFAFLDKSIEVVSDGLGYDHDLVEIKAKLSAFNNDNITGKFINDLLIFIEEKQQKIRKSIWSDIQKIYSENPEFFSRRINRYRKIFRKSN